jgi:uncharacterized protein (DUF433 family)
MSNADQILAERIVVSREICHGKPRIAGTRIMVHMVLELVGAGKSIAEIVSEEYYPDLTPDDVLACVAYGDQVVKNELIIPTA